MTDANRTPTPAPATNNAGAGLPTQAFQLLKQLQRANQREGAPGGGVTFTYAPDRITGTFTFPIERVDSPDGEILRIVNFVE